MKLTMAAADAMDEILALQRELAAVQEEDTTHRLSERCARRILGHVCMHAIGWSSVGWGRSFTYIRAQATINAPHCHVCAYMYHHYNQELCGDRDEAAGAGPPPGDRHVQRQGVPHARAAPARDPGRGKGVVCMGVEVVFVWEVWWVG